MKRVLIDLWFPNDYYVQNMKGQLQNQNYHSQVHVSTWFKNWLINFWVLYILVHAIYLDVWIVKNWEFFFLFLFFEIWWIVNVKIFSLLMRLIWVQNTLTNENIACWIFILLRSILYSFNWLCLGCLHAFVYGSHSVKFAYIERDNIFLHVYHQLMCVFISPPPS